MKRHIPGLNAEGRSGEDILEGVFLVRVERAVHYWHTRQPFYTLRFVVLEPKDYQGRTLTARLYCTPKALWKFNWFLQEFGYDTDLFGRDEVDEKALAGLQGIIRTSRALFNGRHWLNLNGFAPAREWEEMAVSSRPENTP